MAGAMNRRVALLFPTLEYGGVFRVMTNLAQGLRAEGCAVDILTARGNDAYIAEHAAPDLRFFPFHVRHMLAGFPQLLRYLHQEKPAFLISAQTHANLSAILACRLSGHRTRCIVTEHSHPPSVSANAATRKERWVMRLAKVVYPSADAIVGVSAGVSRGMQDLLGRTDIPVHTIHTPMVSEVLFQQADQPLPHPWFQPQQPPVILAVGRLAIEKDYPTLLSAFAILRKTRNVRLMILGEGEKRSELEQQLLALGIAEDVLLPGFVENPLPYMKQAGVFVLSSIWEGFPSVLVEALACGVPVVSTRCPSGPDEILEDGRWGELVPVRDAQALASAIGKKLETGAVAGQTEYVNRFSIQNAARQYLALMGSLEKS